MPRIAISPSILTNLKCCEDGRPTLKPSCSRSELAGGLIHQSHHLFADSAQLRSPLSLPPKLMRSLSLSEAIGLSRCTASVASSPTECTDEQYFPSLFHNRDRVERKGRGCAPPGMKGTRWIFGRRVRHRERFARSSRADLTTINTRIGCGAASQGSRTGDHLQRVALAVAPGRSNRR
jgi:hypothetical protein